MKGGQLERIVQFSPQNQLNTGAGQLNNRAAWNGVGRQQAIGSVVRKSH